MKENTLQPRLVSFASAVIKLCEGLPKTFSNKHLGQQLIRSSSSAALNYGESQAAESKADFIHKLKIVLKELMESKVAIQLLENSKSTETADFSQVLKENSELIAIFIASLKKLKS